MNGAALEGYRNGRHTAQRSGHSRTLLRMPEAKREAIIIAQERMIRELRDQNLEMAKNNIKGIKKVKAEVV